MLTSAGALGSTGVIYVPAFNGQTKLGNQEIRKILLDMLPALGEHAAEGGHAADDGAAEPQARRSSSARWPTPPRSPAIATAPASA